MNPLFNAVKETIKRINSYSTQNWGRCVNGAGAKRDCETLQKMGFPIFVTYENGNAWVPCSRFKYTLKGGYTPTTAKAVWAWVEANK